MNQLLLERGVVWWGMHAIFFLLLVAGLQEVPVVGAWGADQHNDLPRCGHDANVVAVVRQHEQEWWGHRP